MDRLHRPSRRQAPEPAHRPDRAERDLDRRRDRSEAAALSPNHPGRGGRGGGGGSRDGSRVRRQDPAARGAREDLSPRSEERRVGKSVDLGGRRIIKKIKRKKRRNRTTRE